MQNQRRSYDRRAWLALGSVAVAAVATAIAAPLGGARSQAAPVNTAEPTLSGSSVTGQKLTVSNGSWNGAPTTFTYRWLRCDTAGANCAEIGGETTATHTVSADDVGKRLRGRVTAQNADGSTAATSNASQTVVLASQTGPPVSTKAPSISGTPAVGQQLRAAAGDWNGAQPISFAFQWLRCDGGGNNCISISNATDDAYTAAEADQGKTLRVRVTARNDQGTTSALVTPTAAVTAAPGPSGAIKLPNGLTSVPASSVPATERLIVDQVAFDPSVIRSRTAPFTIRITVKDTRGYVVRDALVFIRSTPLVTRRSDDRDTATGQDGVATVTMTPERDFPQLNPAYAVQFYVKAYRQGDRDLGGIAGTRLVQVPLGR